MASVNVPMNQVADLLQQWLDSRGSANETVEIEISPGQVVIRSSGIEDEHELRAWLQGAMDRYQDALLRLKDA